jgi:hypothetical protein
MAHLTRIDWHVYATDTHTVEITVTSATIDHTDISSAELRITDLPAVALTVEADAVGYKLTAELEIEATDSTIVRHWTAKATTAAGTLTVAKGSLTITPQTQVAAA